MKRLVFCFDGTWQTLNQPCPTNVVFTAESVVPFVTDNIAQAIFYDEGIGSDPRDHLNGGVFGDGMMKVLADAYRFLIFNYQSGDQLFVFGFSRGAFTARSFVGLVSNCGILDQRFAGKSVNLINLYQERDDSALYRANMMKYRGQYCSRACVTNDEDQWRTINIPGYSAGQAPLLNVAYLGVWETVGALGIPAWLPLSDIADTKYKFHDTNLTSLVHAARHAVAIDERRLDYSPTLFANIDELNKKAGFASEDAHAPYQQKWFPGDHGSVGGGGDRRGLSDQALEWVWDGARSAGLVLDTSPGSRIYELNPTPLEWLGNCSSPLGWGIGDDIQRFEARNDRDGPSEIQYVSVIASRRWQAPAANLPEKEPYRPGTLKHVSKALNQLPPVSFSGSTGNQKGFKIHVVKKADTLRGLAHHYYGDSAKSSIIFDANAWKLADADHIYIGQSLRIPDIAPTAAIPAPAPRL